MDEIDVYKFIYSHAKTAFYIKINKQISRNVLKINANPAADHYPPSAGRQISMHVLSREEHYAYHDEQT